MGRDASDQMSREHLSVVFKVSAAILTIASFVLAASYAAPEPFFYYQRADANRHIGVSTAVMFLWAVWSVSIVGLVVAGVFRARWLGGLLLAAVCTFYLQCSPAGYLDDLENFMLSREQQQCIELPKHKS